MLVRIQEKGILIHCWWECKLVQPVWKTVWKLLKKLEIELTYDPSILLLGIYLKKYKSGNNKDTCTPMFIVALFTISKLWKQPKCPATDEWIKKMWYTYTMKFYSVIKNEILSSAGEGMELENTILSEVSQVQEDKGRMFSLMWKIDPIQTQALSHVHIIYTEHVSKSETSRGN
jgi:hypothetical protein